MPARITSADNTSPGGVPTRKSGTGRSAGKTAGQAPAATHRANPTPVPEPVGNAPVSLHLSFDEPADELLSRDPLALLIGMVLDQQFPLERAFAAPYLLTRRLGRGLDAADLAGRDPLDLAAIFAKPPALHRFPGSMAGRVQQLCQHLLERYDGDAAGVWRDATDGAELLGRVKALPGFGEQKAKIFVGLLGKQLGVTPPGWHEAAGPFGQPGSYRSVADIVDEESLHRVRAFKKEAKRAAGIG